MTELFSMLLAFSSVPDLINGLFELIGGLLSLAHVRVIWRDKMVRGMALTPLAFITAWGYWNIFYYPSLFQWFSFLGGVVMACTNTAWLVLAVYYSRKEARTLTANSA